MAIKSSTGKLMQSDPTPMKPQAGGGALGERAVDIADPVADTDANGADRIVAAFYEAGRAAISQWGGVEAMARLWGGDLGDISRRLNRKQHKGTTCHAFGDFWALACSDETAFLTFMAHLSEFGGLEPPKKKRRPRTPDETIAALKRQLKLFGPAGDKALAAAGVEDDQ